MPNAVDHIFNKKTLDTAISKFQFPHGEELSAKIEILSKWKEFIESQDVFKEKETSIDGRFLQNLFSDVLGYKFRIDSPSEWTMRHEQTSQFDATSADGVLGFMDAKGEDIRVVIELKGATVNLDAKQQRKGFAGTPVEQAFGYVPKSGKNCKWVIVSNYIELRFYHHSTMIEYETFKIADLVEENEFKRFYYLLCNENLISKSHESQIDGLYTQNEAEQERISKQFYKEYKLARTHLFNHICEKNKGLDEIFILEKTQKLLDRFIFICFCEDTGLLPERIFRKVVKQAQESFTSRSIWGELKGLFISLDKGNPAHDINAFNGGLFAEDPELDSLIIDDEIFDELAEITDYDFDSDLNVNILGHIFEQSISDLEEFRAEINDEEIDKKKGKRKKDGIFYTPEYITKYIVENTIGTWLEDRKKELMVEYLPELTEDDYKSIRRTKKGNKLLYNKNIERHIKFWTSYKEKLANIKVLDPACGSGAFLVQAFDFLHREGQTVNNTLADLMGGQMDIEDLDKSILSNNLYGVDLNGESVEITKLSLWIKTANRFSQLTILKDNIKCGNSLIDDPAIAGNKAFKWEKEFSDVFKKGGFDVVIGNPPYFNVETLGLDSLYVKHLQEAYKEVWMDKSDILFYFIKKAIDISNSNVCFIVSNAFLFSAKAKKLRNYILDNTQFEKIVNFERYHVFTDASITCAIIKLNKSKKSHSTEVINVKEAKYTPEQICEIINSDSRKFNVSFSKNDVFALATEATGLLNKKIDNKHAKLGDLFIVGSGMQTGANNVYCSEGVEKIIPEKYLRRRLNGEAIERYIIDDQLNDWMIYVEDEKEFECLSNSLKKYLLSKKDKLANRADKKRRKTAKWWNYTFAMHKEHYQLDKIWCSYRSKDNCFALDESAGKYIGLTNTTVIFDTNKDISIKYLLSLLNSNLLSFRYKTIGKQTGGGVFEYFENQVCRLPIPVVYGQRQKPFIEKTNTIIEEKTKLYKKSLSFIQFMQTEFGLSKIDKNLLNWMKLDWPQFKKGLKKSNTDLTNFSIEERKKWSDYFNKQKSEVNTIKTKIMKTQNSINQLVYELYDLTEKEIQIVESSMK